MNKMALLLPVVMSGLMISSGLVMAKPDHKFSGHGFISTLDSNGDGAISRAEFSSNSAKNFSKIDKDSNGIIDLKEFTKHGQERKKEYKQKKMERRAKKRAAHFKKLDSDNDGYISSKEYVSAAEKKAVARFSKLDGKDQDGKISRQEYFEKRSHGKKSGKHSHKMKDRPAHHDIEKMFSRMDSNGDGKITQEENRLGRSKWFEKLDIDHDGLVTSSEFKQARKARKER